MTAAVGASIVLPRQFLRVSDRTAAALSCLFVHNSDQQPLGGRGEQGRSEHDSGKEDRSGIHHIGLNALPCRLLLDKRLLGYFLGGRKTETESKRDDPCHEERDRISAACDSTPRPQYHALFFGCHGSVCLAHVIAVSRARWRRRTGAGSPSISRSGHEAPKPRDHRWPRSSSGGGQAKAGAVKPRPERFRNETAPPFRYVGSKDQRYLSVTAPSEAVATSLAYFARTPRVSFGGSGL